MHLVNIKKAACGIKNCATLAADDPTFNHPELANLNAAPAAGANIGNTPIHPEPIPASGAPDGVRYSYGSTDAGIPG